MVRRGKFSYAKTYNGVTEIETSADMKIEMQFDSKITDDALVNREYFDYKVAVMIASSGKENEQNSGTDIIENDYCKIMMELFPIGMIISSDRAPQTPGVVWDFIQTENGRLKKGDTVVNKNNSTNNYSFGSLAKHSHQLNNDFKIYTESGLSIEKVKNSKEVSLFLEKVGMDSRNQASGYLTNFWIVIKHDTNLCKINPATPLLNNYPTTEKDSTHCRASRSSIENSAIEKNKNEQNARKKLNQYVDLKTKENI